MAKKSMLALVKTGKGKGLVELKEVPVPRIKENEVLLEIKAAGICGSDLHIYHDRFPYWPPVVLGHEFAGVIVEKGEKVKGWKIGDRVVGEPHTLACGKCWLCRTGNRQICADKRSPGWGIDGCFAQYMRFPEPELLHRIPETLPFEEAALVEPTANVIHHVLERGKLKPMDTVVVIGPGSIGLLAAMASKAGGAQKVVIVGKDWDEELRLQTAKRISSIDHALNADKKDVVSFIMDLTEGRGADLVVEASGAEDGVASAFRYVRKLGRITAIGLTGRETIKFPYDSGMFKVIEFIFNLSTSHTSWDKAIDFINAKKIDVRPLITHKGGLDKWHNFFIDLENKRGIKGIFIP